MKGLDHTDERYCRIYARDTAAWKLLPWQSKALYPLIERKLQRNGTVDLGDDVERAEAVAALTDMPLELVEPGLAGLLKRGWFEMDGALLVDPFYVAANEAKASDRLRQEESRERRRLAKLVTPSDETDQPVTHRDTASRIVTNGHDQSHAVTVGHSVPCRADPIRTYPDQDLQQPRDLDLVARETAARPELPAARLIGASGILDPESVRKRGLHVLLRLRHVHGMDCYDYGSFRDPLELLARKHPEDLERALVTYETDPWVRDNRHLADPAHLLKRFERYVQGNPRASPKGSVRAQRAEDMEPANELGIT